MVNRGHFQLLIVTVSLEVLEVNENKSVWAAASCQLITVLHQLYSVPAVWLTLPSYRGSQLQTDKKQENNRMARILIRKHKRTY